MLELSQQQQFLRRSGICGCCPCLRGAEAHSPVELLSAQRSVRLLFRMNVHVTFHASRYEKQREGGTCDKKLIKVVLLLFVFIYLHSSDLLFELSIIYINRHATFRRLLLSPSSRRHVFLYEVRNVEVMSVHLYVHFIPMISIQFGI